MMIKAISVLFIALNLSSTALGFLPSWKARQNVWKKLSNTNAPAATISQQRAVRLGHKVYFWGGLTGTTALASGYVFDLDTNTWSNMPTTGSPPSARYTHEMVVVGTKIIVWGGQTGTTAATRTNTGSYFDTLTDTWTAIPTAGAPAARAFMAMVSTGTQVVIWGGAGTAGTALADGKIYDPATNTWPTTISATGAPAGRTYLSFNKVLWTGSKVFIWGGATGAGVCTNTGGLYDPVANTWQSTPTAGAPSARCFNSAAWTGTKVIVWGGDSAAGGGTVFNTGGIYDPSSNTWSGATATTGAPSARHWHAGVWTPAGLVIWGGTDGSGLAGNGKLYDPTLDRWSDMSNVNATSGDSADVKAISFGHFLWVFDGSLVRTFFP